MRFQLQFSSVKNYLLGFATSSAILFSSLFYYNQSKESNEAPVFGKTEFSKVEKISLLEFDPNDLDEQGWKNLGFSERQVATILKYKGIVGGNFSSKEQLKKCYAISAEKFEELKPYLLLPETGSGHSKDYTSRNFTDSRSYYSSAYPSKRNTTLTIPGKFNPDHFTAADFVKMGFSEGQANSILKYKNFLGGSFISKEKFRACYVISEENYRRMEPYLLLPETGGSTTNKKPAFASESFPESSVSHQKFDPNIMDFEGWKQLGFSDKQTQVILNYRDKNLRGSFKTLDDIQKCFVISAEKFNELKPYIVLNPENIKDHPIKKNENTAPDSKTDFSTVDLNQITFKQLTEFGFDEKSAAMILGFRKKLGGFVNKQQIIDTYEIDKTLAQRLVSTSKLDDSKVAKYTLADAPEEWLKTHPYFKYSADKIIYYRITNPNDKKIWKFLKVKPEYEARMKLYLR